MARWHSRAAVDETSSTTFHPNYQLLKECQYLKRWPILATTKRQAYLLSLRQHRCQKEYQFRKRYVYQYLRRSPCRSALILANNHSFLH